MAEYLTMTELAEVAHCSKQNISKHNKRGVFDGCRRKINGRWMFHSSEAVEALKQNVLRRPGKDQVEGDIQDVISQADISDSTSLIEAQRLKMVFEASMKRLEYLEMEGKLVDAAQVDFEAAECATKTREGLLCIPARLRSVLAAETNPFKIERILETEIRSALQWVQKNL